MSAMLLAVPFMRAPKDTPSGVTTVKKSWTTSNRAEKEELAEGRLQPIGATEDGRQPSQAVRNVGTFIQRRVSHVSKD